MLKVTEEVFGQFIDLGYKAMCDYIKVGRFDTCGLFVDKLKGTIRIISPFFYVEVNDLRFEMEVPNEFYNVYANEWTKSPYEVNIADVVNNRHQNYKFIGKTEYYANNIINILKTDMDRVIDGSSRYIFVQGTLPDGAAIVTFKEKNGDLYFEIPGFDKEFIIDEKSEIPKSDIKPGVTYACYTEETSRSVYLDVICKFGKTRSGMYSSEIFYDASCLPLLDELKIVDPKLTECSNMLDIAPDTHMPPIHVGSMILYDLLKMFLICRNSKFQLHFQEKINSDIMMESTSDDANDPHISVFLAPYDYYKNVQIG